VWGFEPSPQQKGQGANCFLSGTLTGNPVSCAAGRATLEVLQQPGTFERLHFLGQRLKQGLTQVAQDAGVPLQVLGDGPVLQVMFSQHLPMRNHRDTLHADKQKAVAFGYELIRRGVYCTPGGKLYLSLSHTEADLDQTIDIAAEAMNALAAR